MANLIKTFREARNTNGIAMTVRSEKGCRNVNGVDRKVLHGNQHVSVYNNGVKVNDFLIVNESPVFA